MLPGPVNTTIAASTALQIVPGDKLSFGDEVWTTTQNIIDAVMQLYNDPEANGKFSKSANQILSNGSSRTRVMSL
jgi:hypothetical protein